MVRFDICASSACIVQTFCVHVYINMWCMHVCMCVYVCVYVCICMCVYACAC